MERKAILESVDRYYTDKIAAHGAVPAGVDWNSPASQYLRFSQLLKLCDKPAPFSLNDLGCGYGALYDYLAERRLRCDFLGCDLSAAMISEARKLYGASPDARFIHGDRPDRVADYTVASGIFNVRGTVDDRSWREYVLDSLAVMNETSRIGFAFNCLTSYSDPDRMRSDLYYADPGALFDHCKRLFSRNVALLHDYGLYEFTVVVRKLT